MTSLVRRLPLCVVIISAVYSAGCQDYLVFTTSTKFGLEATQEAEQPPKLTLGYKRAEMVIIPARKSNASVTKASAHKPVAEGDANENNNAADNAASRTGPANSQQIITNEDTYSVLGDFCVTANPSLIDFFNSIKSDTTAPDSLQIRAVFATGLAAQEAARNDDMQSVFAMYASQHAQKPVLHKQCFPEPLRNDE